MLLEGPNVANTANLRVLLSDQMKLKYEVNFNPIQKTFTVVTDGAAVMARMANTAASRRVAPRDQTWIRCHAHVLQNCMKVAVGKCKQNDILKRVSEDFKKVKKIVEDLKRQGWNKNLQRGFRLLPDVETRFGTVFNVTQQFLKSAKHVWDLIITQDRQIARQCYESLEKSIQPISGSVFVFPALQAIPVAFKLLNDAAVEFQACREPTIHKILPSLQFMVEEIERIELDGSVIREQNEVQNPPLTLSGSVES